MKFKPFISKSYRLGINYDVDFYDSPMDESRKIISYVGIQIRKEWSHEKIGWVDSLIGNLSKHYSKLNTRNRAQEKQILREQDEIALAAGSGLQENGKFAFPGAKVDWLSAKRLW